MSQLLPVLTVGSGFLTDPSLQNVSLLAAQLIVFEGMGLNKMITKGFNQGHGIHGLTECTVLDRRVVDSSPHLLPAWHWAETGDSLG